VFIKLIVGVFTCVVATGPTIHSLQNPLFDWWVISALPGFITAAAIGQFVDSALALKI